jgi:hypothetical protein
MDTNVATADKPVVGMALADSSAVKVVPVGVTEQQQAPTAQAGE